MLNFQDPNTLKWSASKPIKSSETNMGTIRSAVYGYYAYKPRTDILPTLTMYNESGNVTEDKSTAVKYVIDIQCLKLLP